MTGIGDASDIPVWDIPWTLLAVIASLTAILLLAGLARAADRKAPSPTSPGLGNNAPLAPAPSPQVPAGARQLTRDEQLCAQRGHVYSDWARTSTHHICVRCGDQVARIVEDDFDCHVGQAMAVANSKPAPDPDDELALADLALWEIENDWATP